jgi:cytidine deaminase
MIDYEGLLKTAAEMRKMSYVPYSHFHVGAALLSADGTVYTGCNIENASFGATNCAERTAFFKAVSEGVRNFTAIAITGATEGADGELINAEAAPCGICRQVMREFCEPDFEIILYDKDLKPDIHTLKEFLPMSFGPENL